LRLVTTGPRAAPSPARRAKLRVFAGAALVAAVVGCGRGPELVEGDAIVVTLDRLRSAPAGEIEGRRALVHELEAKPANLREAREARDVCARAFRSMLDGLALKEKARSAAAASRHEGLAADLAAAQAKLIQAEAAMTACSRAETDLRRSLAR
jgi:hypothetical protein